MHLWLVGIFNAVFLSPQTSAVPDSGLRTNRVTHSNKEENQPRNNLVLEQRFPSLSLPKIPVAIFSLALGFEVFIYQIPFILKVPQFFK